MAWAPDYVSAAELDDYLRISDSVDDAQLALCASGASRAIDDHCKRQFGVVGAAEERLYSAQYRARDGLWYVHVDDFMTAAGLAVDIGGTDVTAYVTKLEANAATKGQPWTRLRLSSSAPTQPSGVPDEVAVTALWGWSAVPSAVKLAARLQGNRFAARRDSPFGVSGSPDNGGELRLLAKVDPDLKVALRPFVRKARPR